MVKTIAIVGAAGLQGKSVLDAMRHVPGWKVRALTRNPDSESAKKLASEGFEVVKATADDEASMVKGFKGASAAFAITNWWEHLAMGKTRHESGDLEVEQAMTMARAAARTPTLEHYVWSTLQDSSMLMGRDFSLPHVDYKAKIDGRIRAELPNLAAKTTYYVSAYYAQNIVNFPFLRPFEVPASGGQYINMLPIRPEAKALMTGDQTVNVGIIVRQILATGSKAFGKYAAVGTDVWTMGQYMEEWARVKGVKCTYVHCTPEAFAGLWGLFGEEMEGQFQVFDEVDPTQHRGGSFLSAEELGIADGDLVTSREALERIHAAGEF